MTYERPTDEAITQWVLAIRAKWGLDDISKPQLPDTNAADMARCVSRLRAHLKPKHLLTWWLLAQFIGAGIYLAQLASMHFGGAQ